MNTLIVVKSEDISKTLSQSIKQKQQEGMQGIVVLLSKPYKTCEPLLEKAGVKTSQCLFIDTFAEEASQNIIPCSAEALSSLSIIIAEIFQTIRSEKRFIVFDAIDSLLLHNAPGTIAKFLLFQLKRFQDWNVDAVFIATENLKKEVLSFIEQSVDKTIYLAKKEIENRHNI
jgi:archaellum biogenesis ATPase FlaH